MPVTRTNLPFVVYVRFPNGGKEYAYWCNDHTIKRDDLVIANGCTVPVIRIGISDVNARHFVSRPVVSKRVRFKELLDRLEVIENVELRMARFAKLKSPEAKRLVKELKELCK